MRAARLDDSGAAWDAEGANVQFVQTTPRRGRVLQSSAQERKLGAVPKMHHSQTVATLMGVGEFNITQLELIDLRL